MLVIGWLLQGGGGRVQPQSDGDQRKAAQEGYAWSQCT